MDLACTWGHVAKLNTHSLAVWYTRHHCTKSNPYHLLDSRIAEYVEDAPHLHIDSSKAQGEANAYTPEPELWDKNKIT